MKGLRKLIAVAAALLVGAACVTVADAASTRGASTCTTRTVPLVNASVYRVCLTATDSYDSAHVSGYVSGVSCFLYLPTAVGWSCESYRKGSYWNAARAAWEDWLNFRLIYTNMLGSSTE